MKRWPLPNGTGNRLPRGLRRTLKRVAPWAALLVATTTVGYLANISGGASPPDALLNALVTILSGIVKAAVLGAVLLGYVLWQVHRPRRCKGCGAERQPGDLLCACNPFWKPALAVIAVIAGMLGLVILTHRFLP